MNKKISILIMGLILFSGLVPLIQPVKAETYYGNFNNAQLLESNGLVRKWKVYNFTILFNDGSNYWGNVAGGVSVSDDIVDKVLGVNSIKTVQNYPRGDPWFIGHTFPVLYNFNKYLTFYIKSNITSGSGVSMVVTLYETGLTNPLSKTFSITNTTWNKITIDILNKINVKDIFIYSYNSVKVTQNIDYMTTQSITYYQVWDGSTLKYQGLINPNINDFVTDVPTFTPTNTIQLNTVYLGIIAEVIGALTSIGIWWIGLIVIVIDFTFLFQFLLDAKVITGYTIASNNQVITLVETYSELRIFCLILFIIGIGCILIGIFKSFND